MTPDLQEYAEIDAGYQQFCERYQYVSSDPKTRKEYMLWFNDRMREEGERAWIHQEGHNEGHQKAMKKVAMNMLLIGRPIEEISKVTNLTFEEVVNIKDTVK